MCFILIITVFLECKNPLISIYDIKVVFFKMRLFVNMKHYMFTTIFIDIIHLTYIYKTMSSFSNKTIILKLIYHRTSTISPLNKENNHLDMNMHIYFFSYS